MISGCETENHGYSIFGSTCSQYSRKTPRREAEPTCSLPQLGDSTSTARRWRGQHNERGYEWMDKFIIYRAFSLPRAQTVQCFVAVPVVIETTPILPTCSDPPKCQYSTIQQARRVSTVGPIYHSFLCRCCFILVCAYMCAM